MMRPLESTDLPRHLTDDATVDVCIVADPYTEAQPAPLRYRPVRVVRLGRAEGQAVLDGLAGGTHRAEAFTECPWRRAGVEVVVTTSANTRSSVMLTCDQDYTNGITERLTEMEGRWSTLAGSGQAVLEREVAAYLDGRDTP